MNQEQLLDHVASMLSAHAREEPGIVLLLHDKEFSTLYVKGAPDPELEIVEVFRSADLGTGLPPSKWLALGKKLWSLQSQPSNSIKFPDNTGKKPGRPCRPPVNKDDPGKVS